MISLVRDVLRELARHGCRRVVLVNGHYENSMFLTESVDLVIRELGWSGVHDTRCIILSYWDFIDEATIRAIYADDFPGGRAWRRSGNVPDAAPAPAAGERGPGPGPSAGQVSPLRPFPGQAGTHPRVGLPVIGQAGDG